LFFQLAVGFFQGEGGLEGVGGEAEDGEIGREIADGNFRELGGGEVFFRETSVPIGAGGGIAGFA